MRARSPARPAAIETSAKVMASPEAPVGAYRLKVGMYRPDNGARLSGGQDGALDLPTPEAARLLQEAEETLPHGLQGPIRAILEKIRSGEKHPSMLLEVFQRSLPENRQR